MPLLGRAALACDDGMCAALNALTRAVRRQCAELGDLLIQASRACASDDLLV